MLDALLTHPLAARAGLVVLHSLWQGAAIGLLLAAALRLAGAERARLRYAAGVAALLLLFAAPVATWGALAGSARTGSAPPVSPAVSVVENGAVRALPAPAERVGDAEPPSESARAPEVSGERAAAPAPRSWRSVASALLPWIALGWLAGACALALRALGGALLVAEQRRSARAAPAALVARCDALAARLGIRRRVRLLRSARVDVPTALGWLRPAVLLPASALTGLDRGQLELILAHELAHIRRHDALVNALQGAAETLLFYHPVTWWISRGLRREREVLCDAAALALTGARPLDYAATLARLEAARPRGALAASGGHLLERVRRLLGQPARDDAATRPLLLALVALTAVSAAALRGVEARSPGAPLGSGTLAAATMEAALADERDLLFLTVVGDARLLGDGTLRVGEGSDGYVIVEERSGSAARSVRIEAGPAYGYRENGVPRPFGPAERAWLERVLGDASPAGAWPGPDHSAITLRSDSGIASGLRFGPSEDPARRLRLSYPVPRDTTSFVTARHLRAHGLIDDAELANFLIRAGRMIDRGSRDALPAVRRADLEALLPEILYAAAEIDSDLWRSRALEAVAPLAAETPAVEDAHRRLVATIDDPWLRYRASSDGRIALGEAEARPLWQRYDELEREFAALERREEILLNDLLRSQERIDGALRRAREDRDADAIARLDSLVDLSAALQNRWIDDLREVQDARTELLRELQPLRDLLGGALFP